MLDLPAEDRARLTRRLLESLEGEECAEDLNRLVDPEVQAAWLPEIRRRVEEIRRGEAVLIDHEEVFARLRRRFGPF